MDPDLVRALDVAAGIGPFFALRQWRPGEGWRPLSELVTDPDVLAGRIASARSVIASSAGGPVAAIEPRVAASVLFLGLAARVISPAVATAVTSGIVPELTVGALWWQPVASGPWPMAVSPVRALRPSEPAAVLADVVISGVAGSVLRAFSSVSPQVLWGNVASALAGATALLAATSPAHAEAAARLTGELLRLAPLRGTGELVPHFVRRSCCLYYRVPGGGLCGDCVLRPRS